MNNLINYIDSSLYLWLLSISIYISNRGKQKFIINTFKSKEKKKTVKTPFTANYHVPGSNRASKETSYFNFLNNTLSFVFRRASMVFGGYLLYRFAVEPSSSRNYSSLLTPLILLTVGANYTPSV